VKPPEIRAILYPKALSAFISSSALGVICRFSAMVSRTSTSKPFSSLARSSKACLKIKF